MKKIGKFLFKTYWFGILIVYPIIFVLCLLIFGPKLYQYYFVDSKYCLGSEDKYLYNYEIDIKKRRISAVLKEDGVVSFAIGKGLNLSALHTCAKYSNDGLNFPIDSVIVGDTITKEANSDIFKVIKNDKTYMFKISN